MVRDASGGILFFWLVRKRIQPPFPLMSKEKAAGGEKETSKGGFASEQTPHSSSCPPLAADRRRPFRCSSFSHTNRFAGFAWEPSPLCNPLKTTKKGAAAPFLGFSPGLGLCGICFQIVQTRDGCVFDRPAWQSKYSAIVSNVPCVEVRLCAIRDAALAGRTAFRLPYVKYSTGADRTTRTVLRALGKPNRTAARRAFLAGSAIGEWYAEAKCFFRRDSAIWRPAVFSSISFLPRQKRYGPRSGGDGAQN